MKLRGKDYRIVEYEPEGQAFSTLFSKLLQVFYDCKETQELCFLFL